MSRHSSRPKRALLLVALLSALACSNGQSSALCANPSLPARSTDPGYRVVVSSHDDASFAFPSAETSWQLTYSFTVLALPCSDSWNPMNQAFYVWGDAVFDQYGSSGAYPLSNYLYNQIVPQIMVGDVLAGNDASYNPSWAQLDGWVMQAQYFWKSSDGTAYAQTGEAIPVGVGDQVTTLISYDASMGAITASISSGSKTSSIVIARPFPNETPALFSSWRDFFTQAQSRSTTLLVRPSVNVESHFVDEATLCPMLPFSIEGISMPGAATASQFQVTEVGGLSCADPLATLTF